MNIKLLKNYFQEVLPMASEKAELIANTFTYKEVPKNTFLIEVGKICNVSHFIEEGCARLYTFNTDGNDVTTGIYSNQMFANDFYSFFKRIPSPEHLQAMSDCKTWFLTYEDLQKNFHTIPEFREFGRMLLINNHAIIKQRMLSMIQQTGEQRYAHLMETNPEVFKHIPLKNIATYLGLTDTSLSRIRRDFMNKK
jgi:CRP-like cAMP-binding protein